MKADFIVVGRGLAGSVLALRLIHSGFKVISIDNPALSSSTRVAAGLINPLSFRKISFTWRAQEAILEAERFYKKVEETSRIRFYYPSGICRIFGSEHEALTWKQLLLQNEFAEHIAPAGTFDHGSFINAPFGSGLVKTGGYISTGSFLTAALNLLSREAFIIHETFDPEEVRFKTDSLQYRECTAAAIILCEGWKSSVAPWFSYLPFRPAKGEVLTIKTSGLPEIPFVASAYGVPVGDSLYKIGATYEWGQQHENPTETQRQVLEKRLTTLLRTNFSIEAHVAGIRPTVVDRRPLMGRHPRYENLWIFNGLGTRGALLAPLLSKEFVNALSGNAEINGASDINRFLKYYAQQG